MVKKIVILILLFGYQLNAQKPIEKALIYLQSFSVEEQDWENITITLEEFLETPLEINNLDLDKIRLFPLLNQRHLLSIKRQIRINGNIFSKFELIELPFFNQELVELIAPFVSFEAKVLKAKPHLNIIHKTNFNIESSKGFLRNDSNKYHGSKPQEVTRLKLSSQIGKIAFTWKKDKGEKVINSSIKLSYQANSAKSVTQVNIGAYSLHLGEGLIHSNKFIIGKSAPLNSFYKVSNKLNLNSSSSETNFENGLAFQARKNIFSSTTFISRNLINGTIENDTIKSFKEDGLYRNINEINKKNIANYVLLGTSLDATIQNLTITYNTIVTKLSSVYNPVLRYYNSNYNLHNNWNNSISYRYFNGRSSLKGETAMDKDANLATNHFFVFNIDETFNFLINSRYFSRNYSSFKSNTFSEGSRVQNEKGCMFAFDFEGGSTNLYLSADYFSFPNPKYQVHLPSIGKEFTCFFNKAITDSVQFKVFYKFEIKDKNLSQFTLDQPKRFKLQHFYSKLKIKASPKITFISRVDFSKHQTHNISSFGRTAFFDLIRKGKSNQVSARFALFNTDNWDTRIYLYEHDILYHFSTPALYSKGTRLYLNFNQRVSKNCKLWFKVARTIFENKTSIGSGNDEINENKKTEVRVQFQCRF